MKERSFDEMIAYFNRRVSEIDIAQDYKMELLGMVTALGYKHEKTAQQWIPCSKRLPAVPVCRCLITRDDGRGRVTVKEALFSFSRWYDNTYLEDGRNRKFDISASVIAWAPFPAPYRGGDA